LDPVPLATGSPVLYRNRTALPRARLISQWQPVSSLPEKDALGPFLDAVSVGTVEVRDTVYLAEVPDPAPVTSEMVLPEPKFVTDDLDEVILQVDCPNPALLLLADMMAPGWQVEVDGEARTLLTADLVLRAVALDAGPHTVRFHYSDPSVRQGLTLTLIGVILMLLLIIVPSVWPRLRPEMRPQTSGAENPDV
jgi:hypothetical protein